jgi:hypothetical protein
MKELLLPVELVPNSCWFSNVRSNVTSHQWDSIRNVIYAEANFKCEICGGKGVRHSVECHEIWSYDDEKLIQKLEKLQALCPACHEVKHFGLARVRGHEQRALKKFMKINKLTYEEANIILDFVFQQWENRNKKTWTLDISFLETFGIDTKKLIDKKRRSV